MTFTKRILTALVFVILAVSMLSLSAFADEKGRVIDKAGLLDDPLVIEAVNEFEKSTGYDLYIVTTNTYMADPSDFELPTYGTDTCILIIESTYGEIYYELFTYGAANDSITDTEVLYILDNSTVYNELKYGDATDGALRFVELITTACEGTLQESVFKTILISLIIAVIIAAIPVIIIFAAYKKKLKGTVYPLESYTSLNLNNDLCSDMFIGSFVTKTRINTSSGSSRSGGGRSGGGGGGSRGRR